MDYMKRSRAFFSHKEGKTNEEREREKSERKT
jgi:hypothetical protein